MGNARSKSAHAGQLLGLKQLRLNLRRMLDKIPQDFRGKSSQDFRLRAVCVSQSVGQDEDLLLH